MKVNVDLFPREQDAAVRGEYRLANRTATAIDTIHMRISPEADIRKAEFSRPATRTHADEDRGYYIYTLATPLAPGEGVQLDFDLAFDSHGFENTVTQTQVVENGTLRQQSGIAQLRLRRARRARRGLDPAKVRLPAERAHAVAGRRGGAPEQLHFR